MDRDFLFPFISFCYERRTIIITTNIQFGKWNQVFCDSIMTETIVHRLLSHIYIYLLVTVNHAEIRSHESVRYVSSYKKPADSYIFHLPNKACISY
ncbi:ATP-binding protein [Fervidibacillus albus]|uniref:ATP-binding protein n=1 Tax=Fervidibacillus albus TaxID=2980026 RepID=UPI003B849797